ncbi:THAP domain-containing protein 2-like [Ambystoma mexicanum]|uniref:THAP domain-containing protein 2-like n=1 Tax=Ambystoma mexicanum TaxID=8296 RepID=UPI0037E72949
MPTGCAALACSSVWKKDCDYSFHRFPLDAERRKEWLWHLNRKNYAPSRHTFLCSKHFEDSWFDRTGQTIRLRANAVPTIFSFPENVQATESQDSKSKKTASNSECKPAAVSNIKPNVGHQTEHRNCEGYKDSTAQDTENKFPTLSKCKPAPVSISNYQPASSSFISPTIDLRTELGCSEDHNYYLQSLSEAKRKIDDLEKRLEAANKKIKHCQQRERRVNTKCTKLKYMLDDLKKKSLSEESAMEAIESTLGGVSLEILRNEMSNRSKDPHGHRYSTSLIEFCLTLYSYSPKAYEYVRLHLAIPHPHTLRKWMDITDGDPACKSLTNSRPQE